MSLSYDTNLYKLNHKRLTTINSRHTHGFTPTERLSVCLSIEWRNWWIYIDGSSRAWSMSDHMAGQAVDPCPAQLQVKR